MPTGVHVMWRYFPFLLGKLELKKPARRNQVSGPSEGKKPALERILTTQNSVLPAERWGDSAATTSQIVGGVFHEIRHVFLSHRIRRKSGTSEQANPEESEPLYSCSVAKFGAGGKTLLLLNKFQPRLLLHQTKVYGTYKLPTWFD